MAAVVLYVNRYSQHPPPLSLEPSARWPDERSSTQVGLRSRTATTPARWISNSYTSTRLLRPSVRFDAWSPPPAKTTLPS